MAKTIVYVGNRDIKEDNIAQTGLIWARGEKHTVEDEKKAAMLLAHPEVWADADKPYELRPCAVEPIGQAAPVPRVQLMPQGGAEASPFWEPITFSIPAETFDQVRDKALEVVFMSPDDAELFKAWKADRAVKSAQAERMRSAKAEKKAALAA